MPISSKFQKRFNILMEEFDCTRKDIVVGAKINSSALANALNYGIIPTPKTLCKIADFFEISVDYILGDVDKDNYIPALERKSFYERLSSLAQEKHITFYKLAHDCGIDKTVIYNCHARNSVPSYDIFKIFCSYFNVSADYLLGRTDFKN